MKERHARLVRRVAAGAAALSLATVAATLVVAIVPRFREAILSRIPAAYAEGDVLTLLPTDLRLERRNVVLFSRHDCGICQQSKVEFAKLVADLSGARFTRVILVVPAPVSEDEMMFGREIGLKQAGLLGLTLRGTRLRGVPSVAVVDEHGKILMFHEGSLTEETRGRVASVAAN
jgi:hypothetical protein